MRVNFGRFQMKSSFLRYAGFFMLLILSLAFAGCSGDNKAQAAASATGSPSTGEEIPPVRSGSSVMAEGKVIPVQETTLSFITGGVVDQMFVSEGDHVKAGQPLIRLNGKEKFESAAAAAELELLTAQQAYNDLKSTAEVARSQAQFNLAAAQKELDKAEKRIYSKDYKRGDQEQIDTARANYIIAEDGVKQATKIYDRVDDRPEDDPVRAEAFSHLAATRQIRDTALANLNYLIEKPNNIDIAEVDAKLAVAQANVAEAQRQLALVQDGPDKDKLALAEARMKNAKAGLNAANSSLADLELTAPFDGTISSLEISTGELASPGTPVVQLADFSSWTVETTDLTELNIARIKIGQPAMVRFDALPDIGIIGRVTQIKTLGENRQGDIVYTVVLKLENGDERLRWNMTASVTFLEK